MNNVLFELIFTKAFLVLVVFGGITVFGATAYSVDLYEEMVIAQRDNADGPRRGKGRRHHGPPPEAISACDGAYNGDPLLLYIPTRGRD